MDAAEVVQEQRLVEDLLIVLPDGCLEVKELAAFTHLALSSAAVNLDRQLG
jgi:hypothetical protein